MGVGETVRFVLSRASPACQNPVLVTDSPERAASPEHPMPSHQYGAWVWRRIPFMAGSCISDLLVECTMVQAGSHNFYVELGFEEFSRQRTDSCASPFLPCLDTMHACTLSCRLCRFLFLQGKFLWSLDLCCPMKLSFQSPPFVYRRCSLLFSSLQSLVTWLLLHGCSVTRVDVHTGGGPLLHVLVCGCAFEVICFPHSYQGEFHAHLCACALAFKGMETFVRAFFSFFQMCACMC